MKSPISKECRVRSGSASTFTRGLLLTRTNSDVNAGVLSGILIVMTMDLRQLPEPSPPPIQEPPDGPENPDIPVREPDPEEPFQMSSNR
jgi:hypothetical protein